MIEGTANTKAMRQKLVHSEWGGQCGWVRKGKSSKRQVRGQILQLCRLLWGLRVLAWVSVSYLILEDCTSSIFLLLLNSLIHSVLASVPLINPYGHSMETALRSPATFLSVNITGIFSPCHVSPLSNWLCWPLWASWSTLISRPAKPTVSLLSSHLCGSFLSHLRVHLLSLAIES